MKKNLKISTLIIGIIVAVIALSNSRSYAEAQENLEATELKAQDTEMIAVLEKLFDTKQDIVPCKKCIKFYNINNELIYECRDKDDERLKTLLRRSDLVLQTDTSSYYLLGN